METFGSGSERDVSPFIDQKDRAGVIQPRPEALGESELAGGIKPFFSHLEHHWRRFRDCSGLAQREAIRVQVLKAAADDKEARQAWDGRVHIV